MYEAHVANAWHIKFISLIESLFLSYFNFKGVNSLLGKFFIFIFT